MSKKCCKKRNGKILSFILIVVGIALIVCWMPLWLWFLIAGIILIVIGIDIYYK
ncbi:hypothetical protein Q428_03140 [Fervidicella metallireducens AeB]|uniref:Uncharacterized protein n=1 Tax=Fervidicella metallireducens AeB TaxID=1403537 RepID=A0A017RXZ5_9CLOT|nr:hypothetical protein [Fervidicella metallireducens]EYE89284.1 hypothetical protein Q428_03140 [Fervidicella metallireducens AeB]